MKFLVLAVMLVLSACTAGQRNDLKLKASDLLSKEAGKFLSSQFEGPEFASLMCGDEVAKVEAKIQSTVDDVLKAERANKILNKSVTGDVAGVACAMLVEKVVGRVGSEYLQSYPCSEKLLGVGLAKLSEKVCPLVVAKLQ